MKFLMKHKYNTRQKKKQHILTTTERERACRTIQRILHHELDPITLRPIKTPFKVQRSGVLLNFDAHTIADYIKSSGDLADPVARQPWANHELKRLQRLTGVRLETNHDMQTSRDEETARRQLLFYLSDELLSTDPHDLGVQLGIFENILQVIDRRQDELNWILDRAQDAGMHHIVRLHRRPARTILHPEQLRHLLQNDTEVDMFLNSLVYSSVMMTSRGFGSQRSTQIASQLEMSTSDV